MTSQNKSLSKLVNQAKKRTTTTSEYSYAVDQTSLEKAVINLLSNEIFENINLIRKELMPISINKDGYIHIVDSKALFGDNQNERIELLSKCFNQQFKPKSDSDIGYFLFNDDVRSSIKEPFDKNNIETELNQLKAKLKVHGVHDIFIKEKIESMSQSSFANIMLVFQD